MLRKGLAVLFGLALTAIVVCALLVWSDGLPYWLMDLDDDGFVTPSEALGSINFGYRPAETGKANCTEIYALKDGMPLKVVCPN